MPITLSFDIETNSVKDSNDRTRIQVAFLRLGWEHIGGSSWRYPAVGATPDSEDWFNHVIPALMYFRSIVEHSEMNVYRFTVDSHSEAAFRGNKNPAVGSGIVDSNHVKMYPTGLKKKYDEKLSEDRLRKFLADASKSLE